MIPTVLVLNPEVVTFTAKVKIAPTTSRKMLTPRLKLLDFFVLLGACGAVRHRNLTRSSVQATDTRRWYEPG
jgi:hypothetical protein